MNNQNPKGQKKKSNKELKFKLPWNIKRTEKTKKMEQETEWFPNKSIRNEKTNQFFSFVFHSTLLILSLNVGFCWWKWKWVFGFGTCLLWELCSCVWWERVLIMDVKMSIYKENWGKRIDGEKGKKVAILWLNYQFYTTWFLWCQK